MAAPFLLLLVAALLPLAGFILLLSIGKRLGSPLAGWVGTSFIIASFGCTLGAMIRWYEGHPGGEIWGFNQRPIFRTVGWFAVGANPHALFSLGVYIDSLTIAMFAMVTLVAVVVHIYAVGYFRREGETSREFAWLGLAVFCILAVVLSGTLLQAAALLIFSGFGSYFLIGGRFQRTEDAGSAIHGFLVQRLGDCALIAGVCLIYGRLGDASFPLLWTTLGEASEGHAFALWGGGSLSIAWLTLSGLCLFCGAAARCAQFPLHGWLVQSFQTVRGSRGLRGSAGGFSAAGESADEPRALHARRMLPPVPAAAMLCSITGIASGVYFVARLYPIFTPDVRLLIAIIGLTTLTMSALIAVVQRDLIRLLSWITVSQAGYMMLGLGVGSWVGSVFFLITHAFIIASLFLAGGCIIAANDGERDIVKLAGGWRKLPVTAATFAVSALAMAGAPLLSKYYSQNIVMTDAGALATFAGNAGGRAWGYWLFFAIPVAGAYLTAFSIARCWMLMFWDKGETKVVNSSPIVAETASESSWHHSSQLREQPALWTPLLALVVVAVVAGYAMNVPELLQRSANETTVLCDEILARDVVNGRNHFAGFDQAWPAIQPPVSGTNLPDDIEPPDDDSSSAALAFEHGKLLRRRWLRWGWLIGILAAGGLYSRRGAKVRRLAGHPPMRWVHHWLEGEMYFPELFEWTLARPIFGVALVCGWLDRYVIDGVYEAGAWVFGKIVGRGK